MNNRSIRVGLVGIGNCASSFVQGLSYYASEPAENEPRIGLIHEEIGGYRVADVNVASAFDVNRTKVGKPLVAAIEATPNNTIRFSESAATVPVLRGPTLDGLGEYMRDIEESEAPVADVSRALVESKTEVLVCYLPVGSQQATEWYAERALEAGCAFVNCIPVFIASQPTWRNRFEQKKLPLIGDDVKSQAGATIIHRSLANLLTERGVRIDRTYQLNFGGNADFKNMLERSRLETKKKSKTEAVKSQVGGTLAPDDIHIGPSDYVPWLTDRKIAHIRIEGRGFGGAPLNLDVKLEVWDSPNSAGIVIDAVRCAKLAMDHRIGGALLGPSAYYMKSPPVQFTDEEARQRTEEFIRSPKAANPTGPSN